MDDDGSKERGGLTSFYALLWEVIGLLLTLALASFILFGLYEKVGEARAEMEAARLEAAKKREAPSIPVVVQVIETCTLVEDLELPGRAEAIRELSLSPEVRGRVAEVLVEDGATVEKGQTLLRIDDEDYRIALSDAEARLALAKETLRSTKELVQSRVETQYEMDKAQSSYDQAIAAVEKARVQVRRCSLESPLAGVVNDVLPEEGEWVDSGSFVVELLDTKRLKVEIGIPEKDVHAVSSIKGSELVFDAIGDGRVLWGDKVYLSQKPLESSLVYLLRLEIDNSEGLLRPGMFCSARIVKSERADSIVVPLFSVMAIRDEHVVYVVEGDLNQGSVTQAKKRKVDLGVISGRSVEIKSGLSAGDKLIVVGQRSIADGTKVKLMRIEKSLKGLKR